MKSIEDYLNNTKRFEVENGRFLAYLDLGDPNGSPIFFFHGLPGSRVEAIALDKPAAQHGYRIIAPDRPGMGKSDPQPERSLLDWPRDVVALADGLGFQSFGVIGISGGGPFAQACAYAIPERLDFVLDIAGSAPIWTETAVRNQLSPWDRLFSTMGKYLPATFMQPPFAFINYRTRKMTQGSDFVKLFGSGFSEVDKQMALEGENGRLLIRDVQVSFLQGTRAIAEETMLNYKPWGFSLNEITIPVHLFHGTEDKLVPFSFGEFKAKHIPNATFTPLPGRGHFYMLLDPAELFEKYLPELRQNI